MELLHPSFQELHQSQLMDPALASVTELQESLELPVLLELQEALELQESLAKQHQLTDQDINLHQLEAQLEQVDTNLTSANTPREETE